MQAINKVEEQIKMKREKRTLLHKRIKDLESAIKFYCYECNGDIKKIDCGVKDCQLRPFSPFRKHSN